MKRVTRFKIQSWLAYLTSFAPVCARSKFIVFAQGRTGSWLLRDLLNCHPCIHSDKEVLQWQVKSPYRVLTGLSRQHRKSVYGCHVQIKQLRDIQGVDAKAFLSDLHQSGWKIIYLRRENFLRQSVSSMIAVERQLWKTRNVSGAGQASSNHTGFSSRIEGKVSIETSALLEWLRQRDVNREQEVLALSGVPFLELVYEYNLRRHEQHHDTAQRVFEYLGLKPATVNTSLKRLGSNDLADQIENYEEVEAMLQATDYRHFLNKI